MSVLSDHIERFIQEMFAERDIAELQRNELAAKFHCAPSQINYVLTTRFSPSRGYLIESRRGGGGYVRVIRVNAEKGDYMQELIAEELGQGISARHAAEMIDGLQHSGFLDDFAKQMLLSVTSDKALQPAGERTEEVRSRILQEVLTALMAD